MRVFRSAIAYGLCTDIQLGTSLCTLYLGIIEPIIEKCHMPGCNEPAVRVGVYKVRLPYEDMDGTEYRGLCERHKNFGIWDGAWEE